MNQRTNSKSSDNKQVVIIGGGPAGLMAAEVIARAGFSVSLYDAMPSVGRKFLMAGVGGMNITHSEPHEKLLARYGGAAVALKSFLDRFSATQLREWVHGLGIETFVGSSGRVFPSDMKAAPLLRAWLHRLRESNVYIYPRHKWIGWCDDGGLRITTNDNGKCIEKNIYADAVVFAVGGASWQRLGSDGAWLPLLRERNIAVADLLPSNCGFDIQWSERLQQEFSGSPLQTVTLSVTDLSGKKHIVRGEAVIVASGIEGTSIYALSSVLRDLISVQGFAKLTIDLLPDLSIEKILLQLNKPRGKNSVSNFLRKQLHLPAIKLALLRESTCAATWKNNDSLAFAIKNLSLTLLSCRPIDEAISTAGGVKFDDLNAQLMLNKLPGIFCAGEMLDWEAPTGGYLLTACFATGYAAGLGAVEFLQKNNSP